MKLVSIIIRTLNEGQYLDELLSSIERQNVDDFIIETIVVDSGSTDETLLIAKRRGAKITYIAKKEFSFGRSLNIGCEFAKGEILVFISGHCIPTSHNWLIDLVKPLLTGCAYTYGRQIGRDFTKFSEKQLFLKYFPEESSIPQDGFFCNNANSAIKREIWRKYKFDEELTGCEDMALAKSLVNDGYKIGYVSNACVFHIHNEGWKQISRRYEREALALRQIMPEVQISVWDLVVFIIAGIINDSIQSYKENVFLREFIGIIYFRFFQNIGSYKGNKTLRKLSKEMKYNFFYPEAPNKNLIKRRGKIET